MGLVSSLNRTFLDLRGCVFDILILSSREREIET